MLRLTVTTTLPQKGKPGNQWFNFETDHPDLPSAFNSLTKDGVLIGHRLVTTGDDAGRRIITGRRDYVLGVGIVGLIELATVEMHEGSEA